MKNKIKVIGIILCTILIMTGCTTSKAYTYDVETGDRIKIELNTTEGYDISSDLPFVISKDGETLSQGTFITMEGYQYYSDAVEEDDLVTVLDSGTKNGVEYLFYSYDGKEFNYILKVEDSNTGILLANPNSEEEAETCFNLLTFSKES